LQLGKQMHQLLDEKSQLTSSWRDLSAEHMQVCEELEALRLQSTQLQSSAGADWLLILL